MKNYNLLRNVIVIVLLLLGLGVLIAFAQDKGGTVSPSSPDEIPQAEEVVVSTVEPVAEAGQVAAIRFSPPEPFLKTS